MQTFRRTMSVMLVLAGVFVTTACSSSDSSSGVSAAVSSAAGALEQAKSEVCGKLVDVQTAIDDAQAGQDGDLASKAQSLAADLQNAANLLKTVGATDAADAVESLAIDLQNLATAAPGEIAQLAAGARTKVGAAQSTLGCPEASPGA
jgi:hypothetical protein